MGDSSKKTMLIILDGWGIGSNPEVDAIRQANTPFVDDLYEHYPHAELITYGSEVGLPDGQMGNSEVGHLNIGAGRIVYQDLARINKEIKDDNLKDNVQLQKAIDIAEASGKPFHLMGLLSDGGVHSHIDHLFALVDILENSKISEIYIHAFTDGRDTSPSGGLEYLQSLSNHIINKKAEIASIIGRYYAMDRDNRWERIKKAYDLLVHGNGDYTTNLHSSVSMQYASELTDEFLEPINVCPEGRIKDGDVVLFFNYRTDRPRQLTNALTQQNFEEQEMNKLDLHYYTMTTYDSSFKNVHPLFTKENLKNTLGEVLQANGKTQTRIAETEKYPHVTFFFNGGREEAYEGENRILIPSPKVATYDLQPEMSAQAVTDAIMKEINEKEPDFICLNYANTDMVGHTGDWEAAMQAASTVDRCLARLVELSLAKNYEIIIIADHGNSDKMKNPDGSPHTAHTTNPVPIIYVSNKENKSIIGGKLGDIAPTLLKLMDIDIPSDMTGDVLISN